MCRVLSIFRLISALACYVCMHVGYLKPKKVDEVFPWVSDLLASVEGSAHSESRWSAEGTHLVASNC